MLCLNSHHSAESKALVRKVRLSITRNDIFTPGIQFSDNSLTNATAESEINLSVWISPHLEPCHFNEELATDTDKHSMCRISVELMPYAPLHQVQVTFEVHEPLVVTTDYHEIANLCESLMNYSSVFFFFYHEV